MNPLIDISRIPNLTPAQIRDFTMIQSFMEQGQWQTSRTLARIMYASGEFSKKEIGQLSNKLHRLFRDTDLLIRKPRRKIYFHNITKRNITTFAYRINPDLVKEYEV